MKPLFEKVAEHRALCFRAAGGLLQNLLTARLPKLVALQVQMLIAR